jgi:predicted amidophosphoribosyltransferase
MTQGVAADWLQEVGRAALDLVVPQQCAGCGRPGRAWCPACAAEVGGRCVAVPGDLLCRAATEYEGPAGRAVRSFKDSGARGLAGPLSGLLAAAVLDVLVEARCAGLPGAASGAAPVWLVPVPARREARRRRAADHMQVLAGRAASLLRARGVPAHRCAALRHVRASHDQVGLTRRQRRANVAGTLAAGPVPAGLLVLVDDVTTTGATLAEASRALQAATGRTPIAAAVAWAAPTPHLAWVRSRD